MPTEPLERRRQPRTNLSLVVFIRSLDLRLPPDFCTAFNVSQDGVYLAISTSHYARPRRLRLRRTWLTTCSASPLRSIGATLSRIRQVRQPRMAASRRTRL